MLTPTQLFWIGVGIIGLLTGVFLLTFWFLVRWYNQKHSEAEYLRTLWREALEVCGVYKAAVVKLLNAEGHELCWQNRQELEAVTDAHDAS